MNRDGGRTSVSARVPEPVSDWRRCQRRVGGVEPADCRASGRGSPPNPAWRLWNAGRRGAGIAGFLLCGTLAWGGVSGEEPVRLTSGHLDLRVAYHADRTPPLELVIADGDARREYAAEDVILVVGETGRLELPMDFPPLGLAGEALWVLPQAQEPDLPFLGFSAEGNPGGVFAGPLSVNLVGIEGPGHFLLWQSGFGTFEFFMNSRDGLGAGDRFPLAVGSHSHANWGFTSNGVYRLTFHASGPGQGMATPLESLPTTFVFHVEPVPVPEPEPFALWQARHWPAMTNPEVIGPDADPDGDGRRNLEEYALGTDPTRADAPDPGQPWIRLEHGDGGARVWVGVEVLADRSDLEIELLMSPFVGGTWGPVGIAPEVSEPVPAPDGARVTHRWPGVVPLTAGGATLYRVRYQLKP